METYNQEKIFEVLSKKSEDKFVQIQRILSKMDSLPDKIQDALGIKNQKIDRQIQSTFVGSTSAIQDTSQFRIGKQTC